jgi:phosphate-selective porin OprO/OprP
MLPNKFQLSGSVSLLALLASGSANAQSSVSSAQIDKLQEQISALQQELQAMKKKQNEVAKTAEKAYAAAPTKAPLPPPSAIVKMSPGNRPSICTADGQNCIAFTSRLHFDGADTATIRTPPQPSRNIWTVA